MRKERKHFTPEEKVAILRRHLVDRVPVSELCEELVLRPTAFYRWQKELFENGAAAFQSQERPQHQVEEKQKRIEHKSLKSECIRPGTPLSLEDAKRLIQQYVDRYNYLRLHSAIGYVTPKDTRRASAGDSSRAGSEVGRGEGTAEESPPAGGVMDETDCSRLADNAELTQRQGQAYSQRSESPRFREESLHLGMRAAVDQVL